MKRYLTFMVLLPCALGMAQNTGDVLRYGTENLLGTARYQAMGGAFGALGGDLSALNTNPAGTAVFNNSLMTFSGSLFNTENTASYFDGVTRSKDNTIDINQAGGVLVFKSANTDKPWGKIAFAANYDMAQNFDNQLSVFGNSNQGIDNYFLDFAQGAPFGPLLIQEGEFIEDAYLDIGSQLGFADQQAFLGYYGGLIDPQTLDDANTAYLSNADYSTVNQNFSRISSGYNSKFTLNMATQYQGSLHLGASLNFHNILYDRFDQLIETGHNTGSEIQRTTFDNLLKTQGSGFSFGLGSILKVNNFVRLGASYQSPTWYRLEDNLSQRINSDLADEDINFINLDIVNIFPVYKIKIPAKLTASAALVFGENGLVSVDYSYQDMSQAELRPVGDPSFDVVNGQISNLLGAISTLRVGGEYRIERFSLRAGYRFEQGPYAAGTFNTDLNAISGGFGYDFGGSRLDFALSRSERDSPQALFDAGLNVPAVINGINTNATLSYTLNF